MWWQIIIDSLLVAANAMFYNTNTPDKIEYKIEYFPNYRVELRHTFEFAKWDGCQSNQVSRDISINRSVSIKNEEQMKFSVSIDLLKQTKADIYAHLKKEERVELVVTDTFRASASSDCSVERKCYLNDKIRTGIIKVTKNNSEKQGFPFDIPVSTQLKCESM